MAVDAINDTSMKNGNSEANASNGIDAKKHLHVAAPLSRELSDFEKNLTPTARAMLEEANKKREELSKKPLKEIIILTMYHPFWRYSFGVFVVAFAILLYVAQLTMQAEIAQPYHMDDIRANKFVASMSDEVAARHMNFTTVVNLRANSLISSLDYSKRQSDSCTFWSCTRSHLDVPRLLEGNVGITVMGAVTKLPYTINNEQECGQYRILCPPALDRNVLVNSFDIMSFLSFTHGWNWRSWLSPFRRALHQAEKIHDIVQKAEDGIEGRTSPAILITDTDSLRFFIKAKNICRSWRVMSAEEKVIYEKKAWELGMRNRESLINKHITIEKIASMTVSDDTESDSSTGVEEELYDFQKWCAFTGFILAIEGADATEGEMHNLANLYGAGYRVLGLSHFGDGVAGGSLHGNEKKGLTPFAEALIMRAEHIGMVIDLAHASDKMLYEALKIMKKPFFYSHTGAYGVHKNHRTLPDRDLRKIALKGGVIGVAFFESATGGRGIQAIVDTIKYIRDKAGIDHVAIGSGWDGRNSMPAGLDAAGMWRVTDALMKDGSFSDQDIEKIMEGNALRVLFAAMRPKLKPGDVNPDMYKLYRVPKGVKLPEIEASETIEVNDFNIDVKSLPAFFTVDDDIDESEEDSVKEIDEGSLDPSELR